MENKKPTQKPEQKPETTPQNKPSQPQKSNSALIIILIVVISIIVLAGLAVGGWYAYKHWIKKDQSTNSSETKKASSLTLTQLEEIIKYPSGTVIGTDHTKANGSTSVLSMETSDTVVTVYNYYLSLTSTQKWTVTKKSLDSDKTRATVSYAAANNDFTVDFIIFEAGNGKIMIDADIMAENLPIGTASPTTSSNTNSANANKNSTSKAISGNYIIADSNTRLISQSELTSLTPWQLKVARNEIYARHGREFVHKDLQCYFTKKSWYKIDSSYSDSMLSSIENKNVAMILNYEEETSSPLLRVDSGCNTN